MIRLTPTEERPRERCLQRGPRSLSLRECIALVVSSGPKGRGCLGVASDLLNLPGEGLSEEDQERAFFLALETSAAAHLTNLAGLGEAGRARLLASFELGRRYAVFRERSRMRPLPEAAKALPRQALERVDARWRNEPREWLGFVALYPAGKLGDLCVVERGLRSHVNTDPIELFARILALRPSGFVLIHNHPSGNTEPSLPDHELTVRVARLGSQLGVRLLGHWIVSPDGENWLPAPRGAPSDLVI